MRKSKKLFIGPRLRRLRRELGLTQAAMAEELEVSPSYINLIERNQRPLTAELLLTLAETYDLELSTFAGDGGEELFDKLNEAFKDPIFQELEISRSDMRELAAGNPAMAEAVATMYKSYNEASLALTDIRASGAGNAGEAPLEQAWYVLQKMDNHFAPLDDKAERISRELIGDGTRLYPALEKRLQEKHNLQLRILPADIMMGSFRRLDRHRSQVIISETLDHASRLFQLALQIVYLELSDRLETMTNELASNDDAARRITRMALANYTAGAILMPYGTFRNSAKELRFDIEALGRRFGTSYEQVCHRLTTLQRPGYEGIPFFFLRIDAAGNVSKRYDGGGFPFARMGGSCPMWNVHDVFRTPRKILTQVIEVHGGDKFFSVARTVKSGSAGYGAPSIERAVALVCPIQYAPELIYAESHELEKAATPIGVTCRLCDRQDCIARAQPPLNKRILTDDYRRTAAPFAFAFD